MNDITRKFKEEFAKYEDFKEKLEVLIKELLIQNEINFHKLEARVKTPSKLEEKIIRKNDKYNSIDDITDLIGIRIITYFENEVDKVSQIILTEFEQDKENSIDKRQLENDKFGYKSLHNVVSLKKERKALTEYKRFKNIKFEVQIRSILQHAWAEIEHDIGYKGERAIPDIVKRNFYRVAALLETADIEFVNITNSLALYELTLSESIKNNPEEVELNSASLNSYLATSSIVNEIDKIIAKENNLKLNTFYHDSFNLLDKLYFLQIKTVKELDNSLILNRNVIPRFAKKWMSNLGEFVDSGISVFYLCYVLVGQKSNVEFAIKYYHDIVMNQNANDKTTARANQILEIYQSLLEV